MKTMKCSVCGKEISAGSSHCPECGQSLNTGKTEFDSVKKLWEAAEAETKRYESRRDKAKADVIARRPSGCGKKIGCLLLIAVLIGAVIMVPGFEELLDMGAGYLNAWWAMEQGDYVRAGELFGELDDFLNAEENGRLCQEKILGEIYENAIDAYQRDDYEQAMALFEQLGDYSDAAAHVKTCARLILEGIPAPVYHWSFDEDLSEAGGTETNQRGDAQVQGVVDSRIRPAAAFDGSGDYITGGTTANVTENWTVELLLAPTSGEDMTVLAKMDWKTGTESYRLYITEGQLVWELVMDSGVVAELRSQTRIQPGERWYQVVLVKSGMDVGLFVNGEKEASLVLSGLVYTGEETLTIGDQTYRSEDCTLTGFRGYIADAAIYENALSEKEAELMYEAVEFSATHLWDTNFYPLPEEADQDHFLTYRANGRYEVLVFDLRDQTDETCLDWDAGTGIVSLSGAVEANCDRYYLEGETWILMETGLESLTTSAEELLGSDLDVYSGGELMLPRVVIGGRG